MKPRLVDFSQFQESSITPKLTLPIKSKPFKKINTIHTLHTPKKLLQDNTISILFNLVFIIIFIIGIYLLYLRHKKKDENKIKYNKKIENLYNTINKY